VALDPYERLADHVEAHLDLARIMSLIELSSTAGS
jgi:hypothetical protein